MNDQSGGRAAVLAEVTSMAAKFGADLAKIFVQPRRYSTLE